MQGYLSPWRQHHGIDHPAQLIKIMKMLSVSDTLPHWMVDFAWYHDAILIPGSGENERLSAELYAKHVGAFMDPITGLMVFPSRPLENAHKAILATENPLLNTHPPMLDVCLDADASVLGAPREEYLEYCFGLESEYFMYYMHTKSAMDMFTKKDILKMFLIERKRTVNDLLNFLDGGGRIFKTEIGSNLWEDRALKNLREEQDSLQKRLRTLA